MTIPKIHRPPFHAMARSLLVLAPLLVTAVAAEAANDAARIALEHLRGVASARGLRSADVAELVVTDQYTSSHNGVTHVYVAQQTGGIEIYNSGVTVAVDRDGNPHSAESRLQSGLGDRVGSLTAGISATTAVERAADALGLELTEALRIVSPATGASQKTVLSKAGISSENIPAKLVYFPTGDTDDAGDALRLAWNLSIYLLDGSHWWTIHVDALSGEILSQNDFVVYDHWDVASGAFDQDAALESDGAIGVEEGSYLVFPLPVESPNHGSRAEVFEAADATASPFGWHDTDGLPGPEFSDTRGNNVLAQEDADANNSGGFRPDGGPTLSFVYPFDESQGPTGGTNLEAAISNLFYWNNILHDVAYQYGFSEAAGNFQENNYGEGGLASDPVNADAQDGSGRNNANFATPPDGFNPRMQMFIWNAPGGSIPSRDSDLDSGVIAHEFGHGISNRLTGGPLNPACLFNPEQMGEGWSDFMALAMTARAGDSGSDRRGVATYLTFEPTEGSGLRPVPYSTDTDINPYTYEDRTNSEISIPHGVGFLWNSMLWDMYWALVDEHGFNPDVYGDHSTGGNNLAIQLVFDGMKLQPCAPGFVDGRDAILLADQLLTGGENECTIWQAFAGRGLGADARQGSSFLVADGSAGFDLPPQCGGPQVSHRFDYLLLEGGLRSGSFALSEDGSFSDHNGATGSWVDIAGRFLMLYSGGVECDAAFLGGINLLNSSRIRGLKLCRDGSGSWGFWFGNVTTEP